MRADWIPTVDVAALVTPEAFPRAAVMRAALDLASAARSSGFFVVVGHGIPQADRDAMVAGAKAFGVLPEAERMAAAPRAFNNESSHLYRGYFPSSVNGKGARASCFVAVVVLLDRRRSFRRPSRQHGFLPPCPGDWRFSGQGEG